ncbi:MAG: nucleotidyl transferase AbiEii/AbiGii toxin family protein [bacterium]
MLYDDLINKAQEEGIPEQVVLKEAIQIYVLSDLYAQPLSSKVTFQGGTCLRLVYGAPRYSDDIDFVSDANDQDLNSIFLSLKKSIPKIGPLFNGNVELRKQKQTPQLSRWKVSYSTHPFTKSFSVKIELAHYPAYTYSLSPIHSSKSLPGLPFTIIRAETTEEILADKLIAIAGRPFIKGRDLFDIWFLEGKGVKLRQDLLIKKFSDYNVKKEKLKENISLLSVESLKREMNFFLPKRFRYQLEVDNYTALLNTVRNVIMNGIDLL